MRLIITKEQANRLIDLIPSIQAGPCHSKVISNLVEHYTESFKSHDCSDLVKLTMSIYAKKQELAGMNRKFGVVDGHFLR